MLLTNYTKTGYSFGVKKAELVKHIRSLADELESGNLAISEVVIKEIAAAEDYGQESFSLTYARKREDENGSEEPEG